jgi:hypothetical protein
VNMMNMVKTKRVAKDFADAVNLQAPLSEAVLPEILRPLSACTQQVPPGKEEKRGKRHSTSLHKAHITHNSTAKASKY